MSLAGINLASRALQAHQRTMELIGQNVANATTPGYSRQVAVLTPVSGTSASNPAGVAAPGAGVDLASVVRAHAGWLDASAATLGGQAGQAALAARHALSIEDLLAEPTEAGLHAALDGFFTAASTLATSPDDLAARDALVRSGGQVADRFSALASGFARLRAQVAEEARQTVSAASDLAHQVAALSAQIGRAQAAGATAAELLDQRDTLIADLVRLTGAAVAGQETGQVVIAVGGMAIVQGDQVSELAVTEANDLQVLHAGSGAPIAVVGGELGAQLDTVNNRLPAVQRRTAAVGDALVEAVNALHVNGTDAAGEPGAPFFVAEAGGGFAVNPQIAADGRRVAAGRGAAGDGSVALAIAALRDGAQAVLPAYRSLVADVGAATAGAAQAAETADASLLQVQAMQGSESGVNLDEELAHMVSMQNVYAASARLLSTFDEMLTTLIQRTGA